MAAWQPGSTMLHNDNSEGRGGEGPTLNTATNHHSTPLGLTRQREPGKAGVSCPLLGHRETDREMNYLILVLTLLSQLVSLQAQVTPLVAQLKQLQARALGLGKLGYKTHKVMMMC